MVVRIGIRRRSARKGRLKVWGVSPVVAGEKGRFLEISRLERSSSIVLVVVLVGQSGRSAIKRVPVKAEILWTQALAGLLVGPQENDSLAAPLNCQVRRVVGIEAQAGVVEVVPGE